MRNATENPNPYKAAARTVKAVRIAEALRLAHSSLETSLPCSEYFREASTEIRDIVAGIARALAAQLDGVRIGMGSPSDDTWNDAIRIVERREMSEMTERSFHGK